VIGSFNGRCCSGTVKDEYGFEHFSQKMAPPVPPNAVPRSLPTGRLSCSIRLPFWWQGVLAGCCSHMHDMPLVSSELSPAFLQRRGLRTIDGDGDAHPAGLGIEAIVAPTDDVAAALAFLVGEPLDASGLHRAVEREPSLGGDLPLEEPWEREVAIQAATSESFGAPIIALVERLLVAAASRGVSDVHIEPMQQGLSVRFRIDGQLVEVERHPPSMSQAVATRIKVMASLDIAESRLPQDGRLQFQFRDRAVDVRVATTPIAFGESIVLRILGRADIPLDLDKLGLGQLPVDVLKQSLSRPYGIILITGPTGSGKTTTLYAALARLRRPELKILTVEDPVEVLLDGVNQVQVRPEINLDYPRTLRAFLRQDPDILMVGEIRDGETADIAMRAALTGHLVLSTLHTNTAIGAFTRLRDIGVEPYLTASTIIATAAQRLVRTVCVDCAGSRPLTPSEAALFAHHGIVPPETVPVPKGCNTCQSKGYKGRLPIMEIIAVDDRLREAIRDDTFEQKRDWISPTGSLLGQGLALVARGRTSIDELLRVVGDV
jgi:general secretion pathway protein E